MRERVKPRRYEKMGGTGIKEEGIVENRGRSVVMKGHREKRVKEGERQRERRLNRDGRRTREEEGKRGG